MIKRIAVSIGTAALALLAAVSVQAQTYSNAVQALNPVAYWPLQETTAPAAGGLYIATNSGTLGAAGNGYYETWWQTNGNPGVLTNGNSIVHIPGAIAGDTDTALQQGAIGQYVVVPRATNGVADPAITITPPFTIETWIYPTNAASGKLKPILAEGFNPIIATNLNFASTTEGVALGMYSGFLYFVTFNGSGAKAEIDTPTLVLNQWHHIVATFDDSGTESLYLDGGLIASKIPGLDALGNRYEPDPVSPLIIGGGNELGISGGANVPFGGGIDEVAIYNSAFTLTQVTNHYETGTNPAPATNYVQVVQGDSPSIYLRLDEPAFTAPSLSSSPVANNYGSLGASANGYYLPGATPGIRGPAYSGFGAQSHAVAMDGFNGAVDVGGGALPSELNPTNHQPMTVAAWFQGIPSDSFDRFQVIVGHTDSSWRLTLDNIGGTRFNPGVGPELSFANVSDELSGGNLGNDGNWHFLVGVSDGTNDFMYLDGLLVKSGTSEGLVTNDSMQDILLGGDAEYMVPQPPSPGIAGGGRWFDGNLTQVAFFTNALSATQVQQLYNAADVPLSVAVEPVSATFGAGTNATLSAIVHGSSPIIYQWYSTNVNTAVVTPVAGQTNASLDFNPSSAGESGYYFLIATNSVSAVTSSVAQLTIIGPPSTVQTSPNNIQVFVGTTPTLHVSVLAPSPSYQWYSNNVAIAGATNSTFITNSSYTLTNGDTSAVGSSVYSCVISNSFGTVTDAFNVAIIADPTAPYPAAVLRDKPTYYYRLDEAGTGYPNDGVIAYDYAGGENGSYSNANLADAGGYSSATDPGETSAGFGQNAGKDSYMGNVPSYVDFAIGTNNNAEFTIECWANGSSGQQFDAGLVTIGYGFGGEEFALDTGGNDPNHDVRFYINGAKGVNYGVASSFALDPLNNPGWHHIVAVVDEAGGKVKLYIDGNLVGSTSVLAGAGIQKETSPLAIGSRLSTSTATDYDNQFFGHIDDVAIYNYALTEAQVQSHYFSAGIAPVITQVTPQTLTTNVGSTVSFTVTAGGTPPLSYEWIDPNNNPITGQTNATLVLTNVQTTQSGQYTVTVNNIYGNQTTNVQLNVNAGPAVIASDLTPTNLMAYAGSGETYSIGVSGQPPFFYQWYGNGVAIAGATNSSYNFNVLLGSNTYYCVVSNAESGTSPGPATSSTGTVIGMPSTTINPASYTDRMKITFSGYNLGQTLQDFPVLVELSTNIPGFNYSHFASASGGDLRFTDSGGTRVLPADIDQWDPAGQSIIWVQVPQLTGSNDFIYAYWGNPANTTALPATNVWVPQPWEGLPSYAVVYHLKESGFPYADSTSQYPALTGAAPTQTTGLIGFGELFGGGSYLDAGTVNLSNSFTLSAWVNLSSSSTNIQAIWANKVGGIASDGFGLYVNSYNTSDGAIHLEAGNGTAGSEASSSASVVGTGAWHLITADVDPTAGTARFFVDTNDVTVGTGGIRTDFNTNRDMRLGLFDDNSWPFTGTMDEARIHFGTNSPAWITAEYMTVAQNSTLQSYSAVTSTVASPVTILFQKSGGNLILDGSGGVALAGKSYTVLSSTNLLVPMAQWTPVTTNTFDVSGNFTNAVPLNSTNEALFFRIAIP